uniref:Uncharacterized protein n=1 Tax=viral metagenome TaxID=1070528 RepID=A0A6C0EPN7_9ZZZZ
MNTFSYIITKIIKPENNAFCKNFDNTDKINPMIKLFFSIFIRENVTIKKTKHAFFFESISNCFLKLQKNDFIDYFCKIQKTYCGFTKLALIYRYKKTKIVSNTDMNLNEIYKYGKDIFCMYQQKNLYLFNINDLIKIINTSLTNAYLFISDPLPSKNPYNNIPFNKSTLYNIYFYIKFNSNKYCELLNKFFYSDFNITLFMKNNMYLLREYAINNYVNNSAKNVICNEIDNMIKKYNNKIVNNKFINRNRQIIIHKDFPKDKLIKIFKPYLLLLFKSLYSLIPQIKEESYNILMSKLFAFQKFNPSFGRRNAVVEWKYTKDLKKKSYIKEYKFNDSHIKFYKEDSNFMKNQILINNYDLYNYYEETSYENSYLELESETESESYDDDGIDVIVTTIIANNEVRVTEINNEEEYDEEYDEEEYDEGEYDEEDQDSIS